MDNFNTELAWFPVEVDASVYIDNSLLSVFRNRCSGDKVNGIFTEKDRIYMLALRDAGYNDAQKLIDAIDKHGQIRIFERTKNL